MANLLDLMTAEDRQKMVDRFNDRMAHRDDIDNKISNEMFILAEFGYYYGWQAVQAVRNNDISMTEMYALLEGARKVWYLKLCEQGKMTTTSVACSLSKHPKSDFERGMKPFIKRSELNNG